jgi:DNA polymerase
MPHVTLPPIGTDRAWREAARACLLAGLPPEAVTWSRGADEGGLFREEGGPPAAKPGKIKVPESFVRLAAEVSWHSDPERFARLYAVLWRLRTEPQLMAADRADADVAKLRSLEKSVERDVHKLKAFVRFREVGERTAPRRSFAAWFEPTHYTLEPSAPFFARRFADMDWLIATPDLTATWDGEALRLGPGAPKPDLPDDAAEGLWVTYFRNIFNPARVKVGAMLSEMPKKYWRNLPEASAIPDLLATAEARVKAMAEAAPTLPKPFAKAIAARPAMPSPPPEAGTLQELARDEESCTRCDLYKHATRAVPGKARARPP